jgi:molybdate transport system ATP-binding protein
MSTTTTLPTPALEAQYTIEVGDAETPFQISVELNLERGVLVLFGPSGAGKSLTLQALAGLRKPSSGFARLRGQTLFDVSKNFELPAHQRSIGYIPQQQNLFPFCSVWENVAFGLERAERRADNPKLKQLMTELGIAHLANSRPKQLSGGERQRVALARALAVEPKLILLDEAFASIDGVGRRSMHTVLKSVLAKHDTPAVFVTHDPDEALTLGDRMVRYERGRTLESGAPAELLQRAYGFNAAIGRG